MDTIRLALEGAGAYLRDHPDEATYTDSPATAVIVSGLAVRVTGAAGESLVTDMPRSVGGTDSAPSPGWLLRAAEASCAATLIAMRAALLGYPLTRLEVTVDSRSDDRGILGLDEAISAGPLDGRIAVRLAASGIPEAELNAVVLWGIDHCPVVDAVRRPIPLSIEVNVAG